MDIMRLKEKYVLLVFSRLAGGNLEKIVTLREIAEAVEVKLCESNFDLAHEFEVSTAMTVLVNCAYVEKVMKDGEHIGFRALSRRPVKVNKNTLDLARRIIDAIEKESAK